MTVGIVLMFTGVFFLALSGLVFRFRAISNKQAWGGITIPSAIIGGIIFVISLVIIYIYYPR